MNGWFYKRENAEFGPLTSAQIRALGTRGSLKPDSLVRRSGEEEWITFAEAAPLLEIDVSQEELKPNPNSGVLESSPVPQRRSRGIPAAFWILSLTLILNVGVMIATRFAAVAVNLTWLVPSDEWFEVVDEVWTYARPLLLWSWLLHFALLIGWQASAYASLERYYETGWLRHGRASGFWWIVPLANLVMPFRCLREVSRFSNLPSSGRRGTVAGEMLVLAIQGAFWLAILINVLRKVNESSKRAFRTETLSDEAMASIASFMVAHQAVVILFLGLMAMFVLSIMISQGRLHRS